jgi:hypothetical protein
MRKRTDITLALTMIVLGALAFMPAAVKAGQIGSNVPPQCVSRETGITSAKQWCRIYGDYTWYCSKPESCGGNPVPIIASVNSRGSKGSKLMARTAAAVAGKPETPLRQTSATLLSLLILIVGLVGIVWSARKIFHPVLGSPSRRRRHGLGALLHPRVVGLASIVAVIGLGSGGWLSTSGAHATSAPSVAPLVADTLLAQQAGSADPKFNSAVQIGGTGITQIGGTSVDQQGNTYVAGGFYGSITFNTSPQPTTLTSTEVYDVFVAKYSPAGAPLWARMANGATGLSFTDPDTNTTEHFSLDGGLALAVDAQGNAYVGGGFVKSLFFKNASGVTVATLGDDSEAESDEINFELFVAKYDSAGTLLWARGGDSGSLDDAEAEEDLDSGINGITDIVVDTAGNPYVAGTFSGTDFLGQEITSEGGGDVLLSRLNPSTGDPVWVSTPGSAGIDTAMGLAVDGAANVYLIGDMGGSLTFPTVPSPTTLLLDDEFNDAFIAKYNQTGQALWAKQVGGTQPINGTHIAVSSAGELYLTGGFEGTAEFDSITVTDPSDGSGDSGFVAKFTTDGTALWARVFARSGAPNSGSDVLGYRMAVDAAGAPYVSGVFSREATFGGEGPGAARTLTSDRAKAPFVAHYTSAGNFCWMKQPVESGDDTFIHLSSGDVPIEVLPVRLVYNTSAKAMILAGDFQGTLTLDEIVLNSGSNRNAFLASISVVDTIPPTMACPGIVIANTVNAGEAMVAVNFAAPVASDNNCAGANVSCVPPAGSQFPRGTTSVTCTATDTSNNQTTCSFSVRVFDYVIADDNNGKLLRFNSATGDYDFFDCRKNLTLSGRGTVTRNFCKTELRASGFDRNLLALANPCTRKGSATLTYAKLTHTLNDVNLSGNRAGCP